MTIPIIPGPFSFLSKAGEAVGNIAGSIEAKKRRLDDEARRKLTDILALVNAGTQPTPEMEAEARAAAERLKLTRPAPLTPDTDALSLAPGAFNRASDMPWLQAPPQATLLGGPAERARLALEISRSQAKGTEGSARQQVSTANVMEQTEGSQITTAGAAARTAVAGAERTESDLAVSKRINELITTELQKPETNFGRLAARAAAGLTPYYTAMAQIRFGQNSLERERMREMYNLLMLPLENARHVLKTREDEWATRRRDQEVLHPDDPEYIKDWEKLNPRPSLKAVQQELLEEAARNRGMSVEQYNNLLNEAVGMTARLDEATLPPQKLALIQRRVTEVLSGKITVQAVEEEIRRSYKERGQGPMDDIEANIDVLHFKRILEEAQDSAKSTRR